MNAAGVLTESVSQVIRMCNSSLDIATLLKAVGISAVITMFVRSVSLVTRHSYAIPTLKCVWVECKS